MGVVVTTFLHHFALGFIVTLLGIGRILLCSRSWMCSNSQKNTFSGCKKMLHLGRGEGGRRAVV